MTIPPAGSRPTRTSQYDMPSRAPSPSVIGQLTIAGSVTGGKGFAVAGLRVAGFVVDAGGFVVCPTSTLGPASSAIRMMVDARIISRRRRPAPAYCAPDILPGHESTPGI